MQFQEHAHAMTVFDGTRRVAVARRVVGGWLLTATGFSWVSAAARKPNILGIIEPGLWFVKRRGSVRKIMQGLAQPAELNN